MRRLTALAVAIVVVVLGAGLPAQQTTFQSKVELVNVDAVVVDKDGNAVRGLTANDFALTDRKRPQKVATFEEVSHQRDATTEPTPGVVAPPPILHDVASNIIGKSDHLVVLVIDDLHIWQGRTDKAKELAREVIKKLGKQASMAVLFTSGMHSTQLMQDRSHLLAVVDTMKARQSFRRPHQAIDDQKARYVDPEVSPDEKFAAINDAQMASLQDFGDNMQQFKTMQDAAAMLQPEDQRRKTFVMISEGLHKSMAGVFDASGDSTMMLTKDGDPKIYPYHSEALRNMMTAMWHSSVAMYALDPRGKVDSQHLMLEAWPPLDCAVCSNPAHQPMPDERPVPPKDDGPGLRGNPVRVAQTALLDMASASGGFAITDTDDLSAGIDRIVEDVDHYYLLGFYPPDPRGDDYHQLGVTVIGHPEYTVRHRLGYMFGKADAKPKNKDPLVELAAGVMPISDLPLRLTALPLIGSAKLSTVAVGLEVTAPTAGLKNTEAALSDDVSYSLLVVDNKKVKVTSRVGNAARVNITGQGSGTMPDTVTYQVPITIELAPGRYQLRASATSKRLGAGGSVFYDVTVPDYAVSPLSLSGIALGYASGPRVPVGRTATSTAALPFSPTLDRAFAYTDTLRVFFEVARQDAQSNVALTIAVIDAENSPLLALDKAVGPGASPRVDLELPLKTLGPGTYRLRVTATDSHNVAHTETAIVIK